MTARIGTMSIDGTPISQADMARIAAEEQLHAEQQRAAVRVVAAGSTSADDCRTLLSILGLDTDVAAAARTELVASHAPARSAGRAAAAAPKRARKSRAA